MLTQAHTVLPAADLSRVRGFYHDKLGMDPTGEREGTLLYGDGASTFEVYETENAGTAQNTQMGWVTDDLDGEMTKMRAAGVQFLDFELPFMKTENGVVSDANGRAAWFKDSEGNILCLTENR